MKINKVYIVVGLIIAFTLIFELAAHAEESDQTTTITFSQPIEIPGQVLGAGTYLFKLENSVRDENVVQIFSADGMVLHATVQTITTGRRNPTPHTEVVLAEQGAGQPDALLKWFFPGHEFGNEFVYPEQKQKQLAQDKQQTIVADPPPASHSDASGGGN